MSRAKGHDKQEVIRLATIETMQFNFRQIASEIDLLELLLMQLERRFERPPESLSNAIEVAKRLRKLTNEIEEVKGEKV